MKLICLIFFITALLFSMNTGAQVSPSSKKTTSPYTGSASQKASKPTMTDAADSIKMAMSDAKNSFNTLFKAHKDTTTITIQQIEYDDSNFTTLKESIKNLKGIKSVSTEFSGNTMTIKVPFKGKPTDLWDKLPPGSKAPFKLIEATDYRMVIEERTKK